MTELRRVRLSDPVVAPLLDALAGEYHERYGANDEMAHAAVAEFDPPGGAFVVLLEGGEVVAGGGLRPVDGEPGTCEVKRMWTSAAHRRRGLASAVLAALEDAARELGYGTVRLETGPAQPEAQALYAARGYHRIPTYGRYPDALAYGKELADP